MSVETLDFQPKTNSQKGFVSLKKFRNSEFLHFLYKKSAHYHFVRAVFYFLTLQ